MKIINVTITNTCNDDEYKKSFVAENQEEIDKIRKSLKEEKDQWNYHTQGAMSTRYYDIEEIDLENATLQDLLLLPLNIVVEIFNKLILK